MRSSARGVKISGLGRRGESDPSMVDLSLVNRAPNAFGTSDSCVLSALCTLVSMGQKVNKSMIWSEFYGEQISSLGHMSQQLGLFTNIGKPVLVGVPRFSNSGGCLGDKAC